MAPLEVSARDLRWGRHTFSESPRFAAKTKARIGRFIAEWLFRMLDDQLASSSGPFVLGQRCTLVDVACFPYCASAYWANVDISAMSHLLAWIEMLHQRRSFSTGLTVPFSRPAFFGPPYATPEDDGGQRLRVTPVSSL